VREISVDTRETGGDGECAQAPGETNRRDKSEKIDLKKSNEGETHNIS